MDLETVRFLEESDRSDLYRAEVRAEGLDEFDLTSGKAKSDNPVRLIVREGRLAGDFLWNDLNLIVVSNRVTDVLDREGSTGFGTYPVAVLAKGKHLTTYSGLVILGRAGPLDERRSRVRRATRLDGSRGGIVGIDGLYFNPGNWDGSDIFCVNEFPQQLLMTQGVWRAMTEAQLTSFEALPLAAFRYGTPAETP